MRLLLARLCVLVPVAAFCSCSVSYEQSLHAWYVDPTRASQAAHLDWLQNDLSFKDVPGQGLAVAFHAWGLGLKAEARAALRKEALAHPRYQKLVAALLARWGDLESAR